jgi:hypothetical protein
MEMLMKINKNITIEHLFKNLKEQYIYSSIEDSEIVLVFERNNASISSSVRS